MSEDYDYRSDLAGLGDYLGMFAAGDLAAAPGVRATKPPARLPAKQPIRSGKPPPAPPKRPVVMNLTAGSKAAAKAPAAKTTAASRTATLPPAARVTAASSTATASAAASAPALDLNVKDWQWKSTSEIKRLLNDYGAKLKVEYGESKTIDKATMAAWATLANKKKLNPNIRTSLKGGADVWWETWYDLDKGRGEAAAAPATKKAKEKAGANAAQKTAVKATASTAAKSVDNRGVNSLKARADDVQRIIKALGGNVGVDNRYGPITSAAWAAAATKLSLDATVDRAGPNHFWVVPETFTKMQEAAKTGGKTPAPSTVPVAKDAAAAMKGKSTTNSGNNTLKLPVKTVQQIVVKYGAKIGTIDNKFGPATAAAWSALATKKGLSPTIDRAGPNEAWVVPETHAALVSGSAGSSQTTPAPSKVGKQLVKLKVGLAQDVLLKLGISPGTRDGKFGANTANAWAQAVNKYSPQNVVADPNAPSSAFVKVDLYNAKVDPAAVALLANAAKSAPSGPSPDPVPSPPDPGSPVDQAVKQLVDEANARGKTFSVLTIQQALLQVNATVQVGKYGSVTESGAWDAPTQQGLYDLLGLVPAAQNAFTSALPQLLSEDRASIRLPNTPRLAALEQAAQTWTAQKEENSKNKDDQSGPQKDPVPGPAPGPDTPGPSDPAPYPSPEKQPAPQPQQPPPPPDGSILLPPNAPYTPAPGGSGTTPIDTTGTPVPDPTETTQALSNTTPLLIGGIVAAGLVAVFAMSRNKGPAPARA